MHGHHEHHHHRHHHGGAKPQQPPLPPRRTQMGLAKVDAPTFVLLALVGTVIFFIGLVTGWVA